MILSIASSAKWIDLVTPFLFSSDHHRKSPRSHGSITHYFDMSLSNDALLQLFYSSLAANIWTHLFAHPLFFFHPCGCHWLVTHIYEMSKASFKKLSSLCSRVSVHNNGAILSRFLANMRSILLSSNRHEIVCCPNEVITTSRLEQKW